MPSLQQGSQRGSPGKSARVLDYTGRGVRRINCFPEDLSPVVLLLRNNAISKIENLQYMAHLQELDLADNYLEEMRGIGQAQGLHRLDISNNSIAAIEDLGQVKMLQWLSLSGNEIKHIGNLSRNIQLTHLDLSENNIEVLADLSFLSNLKTLLLHGNLISSLKLVNRHLPGSIVTLSLAGNEITDLNEMLFLAYLPKLEQLSIANNACVLMDPPSFEFDYRPYLLYCCPSLRNLDCQLVSQGERAKADYMHHSGQLRPFTPGSHTQLVTFLSHVCPLQQDQAKMGALLEQPAEKGDAVHEMSPAAPDAKSTPLPGLEQDVSIADDETLLRSDSRYLPVICPSPPPPRKHVDPRPYTAPPEHSPVRDLGHRPATAAGGDPSLWYPVASGSMDKSEHAQALDESVQSIMTEQEAVRLLGLAATVIQAHVRGFLVRRRRLDFWEYKKRNKAVTLIQATWRGYHARTCDLKVVSVRNEIRSRRFQSHLKHIAFTLRRSQDESSKESQLLLEVVKSLYAELNTVKDENQRALHKEQSRAALKIQRVWRGYRTRKDHTQVRAGSSDRYQALLVFCRRLQLQVNVLAGRMDGLERDKAPCQGEPSVGNRKGSPDTNDDLVCSTSEKHGEASDKGAVSDAPGVEWEPLKSAGPGDEDEELEEPGDHSDGCEEPGVDSYGLAEPGAEELCDVNEEGELPGDKSNACEEPGDDPERCEEPGEDSCEHPGPGHVVSGGNAFQVGVADLPEILISSPVTTDEAGSASGSLSDFDDSPESPELADESATKPEGTPTASEPESQSGTSDHDTESVSREPQISDGLSFHTEEASCAVIPSTVSGHSTEASEFCTDPLLQEVREPFGLNFNSDIAGSARKEGSTTMEGSEDCEKLWTPGAVHIAGEGGGEGEAKEIEREDSDESSRESTLKAADFAAETSQLCAEEREPGDVESSDERVDPPSDVSSAERMPKENERCAGSEEKGEEGKSSVPCLFQENSGKHGLEWEGYVLIPEDSDLDSTKPVGDSEGATQNSEKSGSGSGDEILDSVQHHSLQEETDLPSKKWVFDSKKIGSTSQKPALVRCHSEDVPSTSGHGEQATKHFPLRHSSSLGPKASSIFSELRSEIAALKAKHRAGAHASTAWTKQVERELGPAASLSSDLPDDSGKKTSIGVPGEPDEPGDCDVGNGKSGDKRAHTFGSEPGQSPVEDFGGESGNDAEDSRADGKPRLPLFEDIERFSFSAEDYFTDT